MVDMFLVYVCVFNISNGYPDTRVIGDGHPGSKFTTPQLLRQAKSGHLVLLLAHSVSVLLQHMNMKYDTLHFLVCVCS